MTRLLEIRFTLRYTRVSYMEFNNPNISKYIYLGIYWIAMSSSAYNPIIYCFANERVSFDF
ncbi:hypothetical protein DICVIV_12670 [Dictyocaulus viviparus]|uniref:G-protein coupled receptors family 1 profile domain-containing protein n=1 Tax=Dictyocaulus viviparus TaxID=29172 RepID=A0A0D8XG56_DICVI|nr:hypothetical protein DICVIV_12670 [Dictyocaulus viviparus]